MMIRSLSKIKIATHKQMQNYKKVLYLAKINLKVMK